MFKKKNRVRVTKEWDAFRARYNYFVHDLEGRCYIVDREIAYKNLKHYGIKLEVIK